MAPLTLWSISRDSPFTLLEDPTHLLAAGAELAIVLPRDTQAALLSPAPWPPPSNLEGVR